MIIALFALSAAMVIGGVVAVIQGFPFVRLESGLSMVIAGATVASAGAVLSGLAVVAMGLRRVAHAFDARRIVDAVSTMQDGVRLPPAAPAPASLAVPAAPAPTDPAPARPMLPNVLVPAAGAGLLGGQSRTDPVFTEGYAEPSIPEPSMPEPAEAHAEPAVPHPEPAVPHHAAHEPEPAAPMPAEAQAEPELPLPGLTPPGPEPAAHVPPPPPPPAPEPEDDLFAPTEPPALRRSLDAEPAREAPEPEPDTREVVGRYASGGNTYVMYADGAIEADTPQGRFTFASLDELKAFVEGGGEAGSRGAA
ncbi:hypothetical protein MKK68_21305 [Methylobacterium sp. E-016]|jgi:hypothetical protein|uniref:hypothetical protein n=1 Tax=Methylobacterium sp. E-016 TaxID=2836556 RepID=UPI001FBB94AB|nr:hypothetical protein [Methylobacterium sp. E-016]MCJ2078151.1 hypothetical protein [Methylobacterium sp. E-016]